MSEAGEYIAKIARQLRQDAAMDQDEFASRIGKNRTFVSRLENGHTNPSLETLLDIAKAFNLSLAQLFRDPSEPPPGVTIEIVPQTGTINKGMVVGNIPVPIVSNVDAILTKRMTHEVIEGYFTIPAATVGFQHGQNLVAYDFKDGVHTGIVIDLNVTDPIQGKQYVIEKKTRMREDNRWVSRKLLCRVLAVQLENCWLLVELDEPVGSSKRYIVYNSAKREPRLIGLVRSVSQMP